MELTLKTRQYLKIFTSVTLLAYTTNVLLMHFLFNGRVNYYDLRKTLPLMLLFFSWISPEFKIKKYVFSVGTVAIISFLVFNYKYDWLWLYWRMAVTWRFWVYVEYLAFFMIYLELLSRKLGDNVKALAYAVLLLPVVGFMYEIPCYPTYHRVQFFSLNCPFFFRTSIINLGVVAWMLGRKTFRQRKVLLAFIPLALFYVYYFFNSALWVSSVGSWIGRLPTFMFWAYILYEWQNSKEI